MIWAESRKKISRDAHGLLASYLALPMIFMRLLIIEFISFLRMALMASASIAGLSSKAGAESSWLRLMSITFLSTLTLGKGCLSSKKERLRFAVLMLRVG